AVVGDAVVDVDARGLAVGAGAGGHRRVAARAVIVDRRRRLVDAHVAGERGAVADRRRGARVEVDAARMRAARRDVAGVARARPAAGDRGARALARAARIGRAGTRAHARGAGAVEHEAGIAGARVAGGGVGARGGRVAVVAAVIGRRAADHARRFSVGAGAVFIDRRIARAGVDQRRRPAVVALVRRRRDVRDDAIGVGRVGARGAARAEILEAGLAAEVERQRRRAGAVLLRLESLDLRGRGVGADD